VGRPQDHVTPFAGFPSGGRRGPESNPTVRLTEVRWPTEVEDT